MQIRRFTRFFSFLLFVIGILGLTGILGPSPEQSIFGQTWWFDPFTIWVFLVIGIFGFLVAYDLSIFFQRYYNVLLGLIGVFMSIVSISARETPLIHLEYPADSIFFMIMGAAALWNAVKNRINDYFAEL